METVTKKGRVLLYDELRGIMIISMLVYHICYDLAAVVCREWDGFTLRQQISGSFRSAVSLSSSPERAAAIPKAI